MALEVITKDAIQVILVDDFNGILLDHHVLLYLFEYGKKLGEVWNGSGKTVKQAVKDRYSDLSSRTSNIIIKRIFKEKTIKPSPEPKDSNIYFDWRGVLGSLFNLCLTLKPI